jgi:hypothetical protein
MKKFKALSGSVVGPIVAFLVNRKNKSLSNHQGGSMPLDLSKTEGIGSRGNDFVKLEPEIVVRPTGVGNVPKMENSPVIEDVLTVSAYFKRADVHASRVENGRKLGPIIALNRPVNREGPIEGMAKAPPGATASPSKVRMTVGANAPPHRSRQRPNRPRERNHQHRGE